MNPEPIEPPVVTRYCPVMGCTKKLPEDDVDDHLTRDHAWSSEDVYALEMGWFWNEQHRKIERRVGRIGDRWTFGSFPAADLAGRRALRLALSLFETKRRGDGMVDLVEWHGRGAFIDGPPGSGKTSLAASIARAYLAVGGLGERDSPTDYSVEWENVRVLADRHRQQQSYGRRPEGSLDHLLWPTPGLVVLDDLGTERPNEPTLELLGLIVEHLYRERVSMIVTTNYAPSELARRLGRDDLVVGERIVDRLIDGATRITLDRPSLRKAAS